MGVASLVACGSAEDTTPVADSTTSASPASAASTSSGASGGSGGAVSADGGPSSQTSSSTGSGTTTSTTSASTTGSASSSSGTTTSTSGTSTTSGASSSSGTTGTGGSPITSTNTSDAASTSTSSAGGGGSSAGAGSGGGGGGSGGATSSGALIQNDTFWKDTSGTPIYSQGGMVLHVGGTYYWYGVKYNGAVTYAAAPTKKNSDTSFAAVTCYSSTDLAHWKFENNVLLPGTLAPTWLGRLGVAYNATTKKYVLVTQYTGAMGSGELFATSDTPTGNFAFDHVQATVTNVANGTTGDQSLFIDDDGKAYLICSSSNGRSNLYVAPLRASDYLNVEPATRIFGGAGREGNCMFKANGVYYFNSSDLHGWNASHTYTISATKILGPYSAETVMANTDADFSHVTQTGFFITVQGTSGTTVIFAGDRWSDFAGNGLGYNQWMPLTFSGTTPQFQSLSQWSLNAEAGTWSVGPANNYALNPSFEADRVAITQPAGWTTSTNLTGVTPFTNVAGGRTGNWKWQLSYTTAYQATLQQDVTGLPNGTYTLSAWIESSGGQSAAQLFARKFGGAELDASVNTKLAGWTHISIPNIAVTNGTCEIGLQTTAAANQWVDVDDVTLVKN